MFEWISVIALAVAQGIAEFLPISSSGHLLVLGSYLGFDAEKNMTLNIVLHAGTLLAIVVFYFKMLWSILAEPARRRVVLLVIAGSVPAAAVGLGMKKIGLDEKLFSAPAVATVGFLVTATLLISVFGRPWKKSAPENDEKSVALEKMSFKQALLIGCAQAVAITPGISRSGSTISCGVLCGLRKDAAAEFSFLLAIPAIGGAALLEFLDVAKCHTSYSSGDIALYATGLLVAAVVGYWSLAGLIAVLKRGKLGWFAVYLYAAGFVTAAFEIYKALN